MIFYAEQAKKARALADSIKAWADKGVATPAHETTEEQLVDEALEATALLGSAQVQLRELAQLADALDLAQRHAPHMVELLLAAEAYEAEKSPRRTYQAILDAFPLGECGRALYGHAAKGRETVLRAAGVFLAALRAYDRERVS